MSSDLRVVQCNYARATKVALAGARAYVVLTNPGDGHERVCVLVFSRGKRWVRKWENIRNLRDFRVKTMPPEHPQHPYAAGLSRAGWPSRHLHPPDEAAVEALNAAVLRVSFEAHAAESLEIANATFEAVAQSWPKE